MLHPDTVRMLDDLSKRSEDAYPEGGLLYKYTEASRQGRIRFPTQFRIDSAERLSKSELEQLAVFIRNAEGRQGAKASDAESLALANQLMSKLYADLEPSVVSAVIDDDKGWAWGISIHLLRESEDRYFRLELWASED